MGLLVPVLDAEGRAGEAPGPRRRTPGGQGAAGPGEGKGRGRRPREREGEDREGQETPEADLHILRCDDDGHGGGAALDMG